MVDICVIHVHGAQTVHSLLFYRKCKQTNYLWCIKCVKCARSFGGSVECSMFAVRINNTSVCECVYHCCFTVSFYFIGFILSLCRIVFVCAFVRVQSHSFLVSLHSKSFLEQWCLLWFFFSDLMASILVLLCVNLRIMPLCERERILKDFLVARSKYAWKK